MADYYPLISRAVIALDPNTAERRKDVYLRAQEALERQLQSRAPALSAAEIERERDSLFEVFRRVEMEVRARLQKEAQQTAYFQEPVPQNTQAAPNAYAQKPVAPQFVPPHQPVSNASAPDYQEAQYSDAQEPHAYDPSHLKIKAPAGHTQKTSSSRLMIIGSVLGLGVLALALTAYFLRDDPARYTQNGASGSNVQSNQRKNETRIGGDAAKSGQTAAPNSTVPVASFATQRAFLFEEIPDDPRGKQTGGKITWRKDVGAAAAGQQGQPVIRGEMQFDDNSYRVDVTIRQNRDAAIPASHIIETRFTPATGRDAITEMSLYEARDSENQPGAPVVGAVAKVNNNFYIIGLTNDATNRARNIEALKSKRWLAVQMRFANGRLGAVLIEKSGNGEQVFNDVFDLWR